jgi:hypothetical protein
MHQHMGAGVEWRDEQFQVVAGDLTAWQATRLTRVSVLAPMVSLASAQTSWVPSSAATMQPILKMKSVHMTLLLGAASGYEDYDSFGSTISWGRIGPLIREAVIKLGVPSKSIALHLPLAI